MSGNIGQRVFVASVEAIAGWENLSDKHLSAACDYANSQLVLWGRLKTIRNKLNRIAAKRGTSKPLTKKPDSTRKR